MIKEDSRTPRQKDFIQTWRNNAGVGSLCAVTAFGKSYVAVMIKQLMQQKHPDRSALIVVPKIELKNQWEKDVKDYKLTNTKVIVINGLVQRAKEVNVDLLILDECHRYASPTFYELFKLVKYKFILGLTATMERMDGKEVLIKERCPVLETVTLQEARQAGWVASFMEYNLEVPLTRKEANDYQKNQKNYHYGFSYFQRDFNLAMSCRTGRNKEYLKMIAEEYDITEEEAYVKSVIWHKAMLWRKNFFIDIDSKIEYIVRLYDKFKVKTIIFSESIDFADKSAKRLNEQFGKIAVTYHSKMTGKQKRKAVEDFKSGKMQVICTARALDEGFSVTDVSMGIVASSTSSGTQTVQRIGRCIRKHINEDGEEKQAIVVNLYVPDYQSEGITIRSQEVKWLHNRQKQSRPRWISTIDEIEAI